MYLDPIQKFFCFKLYKSTSFEFYKTLEEQRYKNVLFFKKSQLAVLSFGTEQRKMFKFQKTSGNVKTRDCRSEGAQFWIDPSQCCLKNHSLLFFFPGWLKNTKGQELFQGESKKKKTLNELIKEKAICN